MELDDYPSLHNISQRFDKLQRSMSTDNKENKRNFKLKVWQMILLPIILALIPLVYPEIVALFVRKQPQFAIENPIISFGDSILYIYAENKPARKNEPLNIVVEGLEFRDAARLVRTEPEHEWEFVFTAYEIPKTLFSEGQNTLEMGFPNSVSYDKLNIYVRTDFYQEHPVANADLVPKNLDSTQSPIFTANIVSDAMDDDNTVGFVQSVLRGANVNATGYTRKIMDEKEESGAQITVDYFSDFATSKVDSLKELLQERFKEVETRNIGEQLKLDKKTTEKYKTKMDVIVHPKSQ